MVISSFSHFKAKCMFIESTIATASDKSNKSFGKYKVARIEDLDGYKYFFDNGDWLMIRASGTEPVLRMYAESNSKEAAFDILNESQAALLN
jgi:phosphomannomutase